MSWIKLKTHLSSSTDRVAMDFEQYRQPHESQIEWGLKKKFLEAHVDKYPNRNRLLCLASCFINVEMYGCQYPPEVMVELKGCIEEIYDDVQQFRREVRDRNDVKFVKSSDDGDGPQSQSVPQNKPATTTTSHALDGMDEETKKQVINLGKKIKEYLEEHTDGNSISVITNVSSKNRNNLVPLIESCGQEGYVCSLYLDSTLLTKGVACTTKKKAKADTYDKAVKFLLEDVLEAEEEVCEGEEEEQEEEKNTIQRIYEPATQEALQRVMAHKNFAGRKRKWTPTDCFSEFYLYEVKDRNSSAIGIVQSSAGVSKKKIEWNFCSELVGMRCIIMLEGRVIGEGVDFLKQNAKKAAAEAALQLLRSKCWTIFVKQVGSEMESSVSRGSVLEHSSSDDQTSKLSSGFGGKMLKMMGWGGGGIGKYEQGIAEPISVKKVVRRQGLGTDEGGDIGSNVKKTIQDFMNSGDVDDLVFSSDFTKPERAQIHQICTSMNLKSQSYGKGESRHLIVSIKRTASQLFEHVAKQGGETARYMLVAPSGESNS